MITRQIQFEIPGCEVAGFLYAADQPESLGEDMVDLALPGGVLITAGWYPEGSPVGNYRVSVYDRGEVVVSLHTNNVDQAGSDVRHLAEMVTRGGLAAIADAIRSSA